MSMAEHPVVLIQHSSKESFVAECTTLYNMDYEIKSAGTYTIRLDLLIRMWWAVLSHRREK